MASRTTRKRKVPEQRGASSLELRLPIARLDTASRFDTWRHSVIADCESDLRRVTRGTVDADAWRAVSIDTRINPDGPLTDALALVDGPLKRWLAVESRQFADEDKHVALWSAAVAAVTEAMATPYESPGAFMLGRLWETCFQLRHGGALRTKLTGANMREKLAEHRPGVDSLQRELREYATAARADGRAQSRRDAVGLILGDKRLLDRMNAVRRKPYSPEHLLNVVLKGI